MAKQVWHFALVSMTFGLLAANLALADYPAPKEFSSDYFSDADFQPRPPAPEYLNARQNPQNESSSDPFDDDEFPSDGGGLEQVPYEDFPSKFNQADGCSTCDTRCDCDTHCDCCKCDSSYDCCDCDRECRSKSCNGNRKPRRNSKLECCVDPTQRLFKELNTCDWEVHGWLASGITSGDENPSSNFNGTLGFNDRQDEYQLNQAYISIAKLANNEGCGFAIGGRVDFLYGTDSRIVEARGLEKRRDQSPHWNGERFYGVALPQAYLEAAWNDLRVKVGHFYTIVGYEVVTAPDNFFYSHTYAMQYGEPFTHTGALAEYKVGSRLTVMGGFDRGWDNWEDDSFDRLSTLAGVTWKNECGWAIGLSATYGQEPTSDGLRNDDRTFYSAVLSRKVSDRLTWVIQHDRGFQNQGVSSTQDAEWYGVSEHLYYKLNCCWTAGIRTEWFRDDDGTRVAAIGDRRTPNSNPASNGGFIGDFFAVSVGLNWSPNSNLVIRPELRIDWFEPDTGSALPFNDGNSDDLVTGAVDVILQF